MRTARHSSTEVDAAMIAHVNWVVRFKNRIGGIDREPIDPTSVADGSACRLGEWLHSGLDRGDSPDLLSEIELAHGAFHAVAEELARMMARYAHGSEIARQMAELETRSQQLIGALRELKAQL